MLHQIFFEPICSSSIGKCSQHQCTLNSIEDNFNFFFSFFPRLFATAWLQLSCKDFVMVFELGKICFVKFIFSKKATKFCEISTLLLSYVVPVKSKVKISQNFVAFSEYMNFKQLTQYFKQFEIPANSFPNYSEIDICGRINVASCLWNILKKK